MITTTKRLNVVQAQLDKAVKDLEAAETLNKELQARVDELNKEVEAKNARILELEDFDEIDPEEHEAVKGALAEAMTELEKAEEVKVSVEAKAEELEVKQEEIETAISDKALEIVASQGVPPVDVKPVDNPSATAVGGDLIGQLNAIKDPVKQRAFWLANKDVLMEELRKSKS